MLQAVEYEPKISYDWPNSKVYQGSIVEPNLFYIYIDFVFNFVLM